jgi:hypothetical protein
MVVIVTLLLLEAGAIWALRGWQDAHAPMRPLPPKVSTDDAPRSSSRPALTEDDVILFGLALEASDDVMSDLLADSI